MSKTFVVCMLRWVNIGGWCTRSPDFWTRWFRYYFHCGELIKIYIWGCENHSITFRTLTKVAECFLVYSLFLTESYMSWPKNVSKLPFSNPALREPQRPLVTLIQVAERSRSPDYQTGLPIAIGIGFAKWPTSSLVVRWTLVIGWLHVLFWAKRKSTHVNSCVLKWFK